METYQFAIDEMEDILNDVPEEAEAGRIVKAVVQHNLCQLYIDKGVLQEAAGENATNSYQTAVKYASDVIDGGRYKLMTERFGTRKIKIQFSTMPMLQTNRHQNTPTKLLVVI